VQPAISRWMICIELNSSQPMAAVRSARSREATMCFELNFIVEVAAVPIPSDQQVRRNSKATDVIRHGELKLELERMLAPALDNAGTASAVLGYWNPKRFRVGGDTAGVEALPVLNLDGPPKVVRAPVQTVKRMDANAKRRMSQNMVHAAPT